MPPRPAERALYAMQHLPFIVRWPGHATAGREVDALVGTIDLFARQHLAEWPPDQLLGPKADQLAERPVAADEAIAMVPQAQPDAARLQNGPEQRLAFPLGSLPRNALADIPRRQQEHRRRRQ